MFRKSRRRIVATIMSILMCLFLGTLAVIYAFSYFEVSNTNFDMLERHAQMYVLADHERNERIEGFSPGRMEPFRERIPEASVLAARLFSFLPFIRWQLPKAGRCLQPISEIARYTMRLLWKGQRRIY